MPKLLSTKPKKALFYRALAKEEFKATYQLMKADSERKQYERTNPTLKEVLRWA